MISPFRFAPHSARQAQRGTVLIVVAGISGLLGMLALTFLIRMRSDAQESEQLLDETRMRVMFASALQYVAETSRIGWDNPATPEKEEAFGWIDIRTGGYGPRDRVGQLLFTPSDTTLGTGTTWPAIGSYMICNSRLWRRPPMAVSQKIAINPIRHDPAASWANLVSYSNLDPTPVVGTPNDFSDYVKGDRREVSGTEAPCWFRVYRKLPATFIITCGGGSSGGYRDWAEVQASPDAQLWSSRGEWELARISEPIIWFEVAWSPAVNATSTGWIYAGINSIKPGYISRPFSNNNNEDQINKRNQMGTFLYRQRLLAEPTKW